MKGKREVIHIYQKGTGNPDDHNDPTNFISNDIPNHYVDSYNYQVKVPGDSKYNATPRRRMLNDIWFRDKKAKEKKEKADKERRGKEEKEYQERKSSRSIELSMMDLSVGIARQQEQEAKETDEGDIRSALVIIGGFLLLCAIVGLMAYFMK